MITYVLISRNDLDSFLWIERLHHYRNVKFMHEYFLPRNKHYDDSVAKMPYHMAGLFRGSKRFCEIVEIDFGKFAVCHTYLLMHDQYTSEQSQKHKIIEKFSPQSKLHPFYSTQFGKQYSGLQFFAERTVPVTTILFRNMEAALPTGG